MSCHIAADSVSFSCQQFTPKRVATFFSSVGAFSPVSAFWTECPASLIPARKTHRELVSRLSYLVDISLRDLDMRLDMASWQIAFVWINKFVWTREVEASA